MKITLMNRVFISTDQSLLDIPMIHKYLTERSYWARGRSMITVKKSIANSLCFGVYDGAGNQLAFARVITDYAVFGWVLDVFVLEEYRGKGLGKKLMATIVNHKELRGLRRIGLGTDDAHDLYRQFGFTSLSKPETMMELKRE